MGLVLSVLGAGGSMFIVPVLVFVLDSPVSEATGTSLLIVGAAALVAAVAHGRKGNVNVRIAAIFGAAAMAGALGGAALHPLVSARVSMGLFAALLFVAAARMVWGKAEVRLGAAKLEVLVPLGLAIGVLSGFLGVGGGFLIVPVLSWGAGLTVKQAIGTSLAVIAASSLVGAVGHAAQGQLTVGLLATVGTGAVIGALAGAPLSGRLPERPLRLGFAGLAVAVGLYMAVRVSVA